MSQAARATMLLFLLIVSLFHTSRANDNCLVKSNTEAICGDRSLDLCTIMEQPASLPDNIDAGGLRYTFEIDFCSGISFCNTQDGDPPAAVCQSTIADPSSSFNCGSTNNTLWYYDSDASNGFQFTVTFQNGRTQGNGDVRRTMFTFIDNGTAFGLTYLGEDMGADKVINHHVITSFSTRSPHYFVPGFITFILIAIGLLISLFIAAIVLASICVYRHHKRTYYSNYTPIK